MVGMQSENGRKNRGEGVMRKYGWTLGLLTLLTGILFVGCQTTTQDVKDFAPGFWGCPTPEQVADARMALIGNTTGKEPENLALGGLEYGALNEMGESDYLDKMYQGIRNDFKASGIEFDEIERGLIAKGISLEKLVDDEGNTRQILVKIDGDLSFDTGSYKLTNLAMNLVGKIGEAMNAYPETQAKVWGHTDTPGSRPYNLRLSLNRAKSVKNALVSNYSIAANRVPETKGFADDMKIVQTNASEARNRRVEIRLTAFYADKSTDLIAGDRFRIQEEEEVLPPGSLKEMGKDDYFEEQMDYLREKMGEFTRQEIREFDEGGFTVAGFEARPVLDREEDRSGIDITVEQDVLFDTKTGNLKDEGVAMLKIIVHSMMVHGETTVRISSFTNSRVAHILNIRLSRDIAQTVHNAMLNEFPDLADRILSSEGKGDDGIDPKDPHNRIEFNIRPLQQEGK